MTNGTKCHLGELRRLGSQQVPAGGPSDIWRSDRPRVVRVRAREDYYADLEARRKTQLEALRKRQEKKKQNKALKAAAQSVKASIEMAGLGQSRQHAADLVVTSMSDDGDMEGDAQGGGPPPKGGSMLI